MTIKDYKSSIAIIEINKILMVQDNTKYLSLIVKCKNKKVQEKNLELSCLKDFTNLLVQYFLSINDIYTLLNLVQTPA